MNGNKLVKALYDERVRLLVRAGRCGDLAGRYLSLKAGCYERELGMKLSEARSSGKSVYFRGGNLVVLP